MSLHIKYRPKNLSEVYGHQHIVDSLKSMLSGNSLAHAFMFFGASGCGKTTIARILGSELGCKKEAIYEINSANDRGIDSFREIIRDATTPSFFSENGNKVYIMDEFHSVTKDSQNCLLKILEDTPKHCYFIICTTEPNKILKPVQNRCVQFEFKKLLRNEMKGLLKYVCTEESITIDEDKEVLLLESADGCPRQLLVNLNMVRDIEDIEEASTLIYDAPLETDNMIDIMRAILKSSKWKNIVSLFDKLPKDTNYEQLRLCFVGYLSSCLKKATDRNKLLYFHDMLEIFVLPTSYISQKEDMLMRTARALLITVKK